MRSALSAALILGLGAMAAAAEPGVTLMQVAAPVADLRSEPKDAALDTHAHDPLQESQLLFGEKVIVHRTEGEWSLVEALGQREFTHKKTWEGYPGWVRTNLLTEPRTTPYLAAGIVRRPWASLTASKGGFLKRGREILRIPFGSQIEILKADRCWYQVAYRGDQSAWIRRSDVRRLDAGPPRSLGSMVWTHIRKFIGTPYYWGGLSPRGAHYKSSVTGIDCSGLVHLSYRAAGITIPRDSHEQWMMSRPVRRKDLRRGDLVFLANAANPQKVVHVMMYAGGEFLIEGPGTGLRVRRVTFKKKLGERLTGLESGDMVGPKVVYFGRPFSE